MKILGLERHAYAPELNQLILANGVKIRCPGCTSIKDVRKKLFSPYTPGLYCVVKSSYAAPWSDLSKTVASGRTPSRLAALRFAKRYQESGGPLFNGDILPPNKLTFKFYY